MLRRYVCLLGIVSVCLAITASPARAQELAVIDSLIAPDTTMGPIPINEIASEAVNASTTLWSISQDSRPSGLIDVIESEWDARRPEIERLVSETEASLAQKTDPDWLAELDRRWSRGETILAGWLSSLASESATLTEDLIELTSMQRRWKQTQEIAVESDLPESVLANVDSVIFEIDRLTPLIQERLNNNLELESRLSHERQVAIRTRDLINEQTAHELAGYVIRERAPLSDLLGLDESVDRTRDDRSYTRLYYRSIRDYLSNVTEYLWIHFGLIILLTWLTILLHRRIDHWNEAEPDVPIDIELFERPFSAALLVALLMTELIYPHASVFFVGVALILSIWPAYRLLEVIIPIELKTVLRAFIAFLVVILVSRFLVVEHTTVGRLVHFVLTVAAIGFLAWILRNKETVAFLKSSGEGRKVLTGLHLSFIILLIALASSLIGYGPLSRHLTISTVYSAYFVLLIFIGSLVLRAIILGLLKSPFAHRSRVIQNHFPEVARRTNRLISILAFLGGVLAVLDTFGVYRLVIDSVVDTLTAPIKVGEAEISIGGILLFAVVFWIALLIAKLIRFILEEELLKRVRMGRGKPQAISGTIYYVFITLGFVFALSATGMPMDRLTVLAGAFGVGLGFGLQDVVNNFVSGLILLYESPIQVGDTIEFGTHMGS